MSNQQIYIIGNWKSNKNAKEVESWFSSFAQLSEKSPGGILDHLEIAICPPYVYLPLADKLRRKFGLSLKLGAQDISPFENGAYTGEVSGEMIHQYAEYVLIGHSERRTHFQENDALLAKKVLMAKANGLIPVYCVSGTEDMIPPQSSIIAYEPLWAIGSGKADTPENAATVVKEIRRKYQATTVIYGGSVKPENVASYLKTNEINGVLPGGASLDPKLFWEMILNAAHV